MYSGMCTGREVGYKWYVNPHLPRRSFSPSCFTTMSEARVLLSKDRWPVTMVTSDGGLAICEGLGFFLPVRGEVAILEETNSLIQNM